MHDLNIASLFICLRPPIILVLALSSKITSGRIQGFYRIPEVEMESTNSSEMA